MKYSVIIPNYNSGDRLSRLLASIPKRKDVQVLVIDDISTDRSYLEAKNNSDFNGVTFCQLSEKRFAGGARNFGLDLASGEFVVFADSDDLFVDNAFELFDEFSDELSDLILFRTSSFIEPEGGEGCRDKYRNFRLTFDEKKAALGAIPPWGKLIKRSLIKENALYFSEVIAANDVVFSVKLACLARHIKVVDCVVYMVSESEKSLTGSDSVEKSISRVNEQLKRISIINKYRPVSPLLYSVLHSRLIDFHQLSRYHQSECFDRLLESYKKNIGFLPCFISKVFLYVPWLNSLAIVVYRVVIRAKAIIIKSKLMR